MLKKIKHLLRDSLAKIIKESLRLQLDTFQANSSRDLTLGLQLLARDQSAAYIATHLLLARQFDDAHSMLRWCLSERPAGDDNLVLEFGVWKGSSLTIIANECTGSVFGFDSFNGLPEDWRTGFPEGTFALEALPSVPRNSQLVVGYFCDTLPEFLKEKRNSISFLHIDCDLYASTQTIFCLAGERLIPGSIIVFDEYLNYPGWREGEFKAFQEFIRASGRTYEYIAYNASHEQVAVRIL